MSSGAPAYRRILLKLSGEALMGDGKAAISSSVLSRLADEITQVKKMGVQVGIVIGGGNFCRGVSLSSAGIDRVTGDHMGMMATVMNALALRDAFERENLLVRVLSSVAIDGIVDVFQRDRAIRYLEKNYIVIFAGGTGSPLFTTDSAASLRGIEIQADMLLKATNVDGVYSADPRHNPDATLYEHLSYQEALDQELSVMDLAAFCQCRDNDMPLRVFNIHKPGMLLQAVSGESVGTLVDNH